MLYAILCYSTEAIVGKWTREQDATVMAEHFATQEQLATAGKLGPVLRLMPTTTATTVRAGDQPVILDGPFAETKEQLLGLYVVDCATLDEVLQIAKQLAIRPGAMEIRPIMHYFENNVPTTSLQVSR
jgi:hypothetical protein